MIWVGFFFGGQGMTQHINKVKTPILFQMSHSIENHQIDKAALFSISMKLGGETLFRCRKRKITSLVWMDQIWCATTRAL